MLSKLHKGIKFISTSTPKTVTFLFVAFFMCASFLGLLNLSSQTPQESQRIADNPTPSVDSVEQELLVLINNFRQESGKTPVKMSTTLTQAAEWMAQDMASKNRLNHIDSLGRNVNTRVPSFGYPYPPHSIGENAGYSGATTALAIYNGFYNECDDFVTPGICTYAHRENMKDGKWRAIGIARAQGSNGAWFWVTDFGAFVDQELSTQNESSPSPTSTPSETCVDTDGGLNYNVKAGDDSCYYDDRTLFEHYCDVSGVNKNVSYLCKDGCEDGRCKAPTPLPTGSFCSADTDCASDHMCPDWCEGDPSAQEACICRIKDEAPLTTTTPIPTGVNPSPTPNPTGTLDGKNVIFNFKVKLPGIGTSTSLGENNSPKRKSREFVMGVLNENQSVVAEKAITLSYNNGIYTGSSNISLGNGSYEIKIASDNSLLKTVPGAITISANSSNINLPQVTLVSGNISQSNEIDIFDYNALLSCFQGACANQTTSDLNDDGKIDSKDLNILLRSFSIQRSN